MRRRSGRGNGFGPRRLRRRSGSSGRRRRGRWIPIVGSALHVGTGRGLRASASTRVRCCRSRMSVRTMRGGSGFALDARLPLMRQAQQQKRESQRLQKHGVLLPLQRKWQADVAWEDTDAHRENAGRGLPWGGAWGAIPTPGGLPQCPARAVFVRDKTYPTSASDGHTKADVGPTVRRSTDFADSHGWMACRRARCDVFSSLFRGHNPPATSTIPASPFPFFAPTHSH